MSTFDGRIDDLENVLVDNFVSNGSYTCFFLSHCHSDHMNGIGSLLSNLENNFNHNLYCSPISRLVLLNKFNNKYVDVIKELTSPTVIQVPESDTFPSYSVTVTPIPAGHCPGSLMFLFETRNRRILYTGDFRIAKDDVKKFKPLHKNNEIKHIHKIYFDATFLNKTYWEFPLRSEVASKIVSVAHNWLNTNPDHNLLLETSASIGYEYVYVELAKKLNSKIHVKDSVYNLYWNVPEVGSTLTKDCKSAKVHAFCFFDKKCQIDDKEDWLKIKLSAQWYKSNDKNVKEPIWKEVSHKRFLVCYSTHCSCSELVNFLNYLHPDDVQPCTTAIGSSEEDMNNYIKQLKWSWPLKKKEKSPHDSEENFKMNKNYKFQLKFPNLEKDFDEFLPERKKRFVDADSKDSNDIETLKTRNDEKKPLLLEP